MHLRNVFLLIFNLLSFNHFLTSSAEYVPEANILKASIINGASEFGRSVDFLPSLKLSYPLGACVVQVEKPITMNTFRRIRLAT